MSEVTSPIILDTTGQDIANALTDVADAINAGNATAAMLSYVENGNTASQNYPAGTYICWQSLLYTADTAINSGDAFYSTGVNKNLTAVGGGGLNDFLSRFAMVSATMKGGGGSKTVPYPSGYTNTNCTVISCYVDVYNNRYISSEVCYVILTQNNIQLNFSGANSSATGAVYAVLFKFY